MNLKYATKFFETEEEKVMGPTLVKSPNFKVAVRYPKEYRDVKACADVLLNGQALIVSYENLSEEESHRFIDFLNGICYSLNANMEHISMEMIMYTPGNVEIM